MLAGLIRFSLTQRLLVLVLVMSLTGAGVFSFLGLPIDAFPDVSTTQVKIILKAPGMTPEEVETRLAVPVEQELLGIPHQRLLRSTSKYALTDITIDFEDGTDIYWARQQVGERLASAMGNLPPGVSGPRRLGMMQKVQLWLQPSEIFRLPAPRMPMITVNTRAGGLLVMSMISPKPMVATVMKVM